MIRHISTRLRTLFRRRNLDDGQPVSPEQHRHDMIYIWTEIHGVPLERAEAMYEEYERASAVASLGLRGK